MAPSKKDDQSAPASVGPTGAPGAVQRAQAGEYLTTAQGLRLPDTDHSLKAGNRGPTLLEDFHLREKITHFDHERIPGACRARPRRCSARRLPVLRHRRLGDEGRFPRYEGTAVTEVFCPVLHRARLARLGRHRPRHPRVRGEVLHRRGHLRPRRQQHAGVLHPGRRSSFPDIIHAGKPAPGQGDPAGAVRPRLASGTSSRCTPRPPTTSCGT